MNIHRDKIIAYGALAVTIICFILVCNGVYGYDGPVNVTTIAVNDSRVDPSAPVTWTVGPVYNGTTGNPVQNGFQLDFDGQNDAINFGSAASLDNLYPYTIQVWVTPSTGYGEIAGRILHKIGAGTGADNAIYILSADGRVYARRDFAVTNALSQSNIAIPINRPTLVTVILNTLNQTRIYFNTTDVTTVTTTGAGNLQDDSAHNLYFGANDDLDRSLNANMDELIIYNRTIGTGEISYLYQNKVPLSQNGIVLWANLDTNVLDQSPNGNDGTIVGNPQYVRGIRGKAALVFDEDGDFVSLGVDHWNQAQFANGLTFESWFMFTQATAHRQVLTSLEGYMWYGLETNERPIIQFRDAGGFKDVTGGTILTPNQLYFIVGTWNTTHLKLYIDTVIQPTITASGIGIIDSVSRDDRLGAEFSNDRYLNGTIDEARIYNRSLTQIEINQHYQGIYLNETGLILHLDFDNNVVDQSGNGNNGTINGDPEYSDGWAFCPLTSSYNGVDSTTVSLVNSTTGLSTLYDTSPAIYGTYNVTIYPPTLTSVLNGTFTGFIVDLYNIDVYALFTEVEAGFQTLIYANGSSVIDGHPLTNGDTLVIEGVTLTWNTYMARFEATDTEATATIKTYDTLTTLLETTYGITNGNISTPVTVIWTTPSLDLIMPFMRIGDWPGAIIQINILLMGQTIFWTLLMASISMAIYNYSGAETAIAAWILGWGIFSPVIHGEAVTISLIMIALAGGIYIAKFFLDRRTSV